MMLSCFETFAGQQIVALVMTRVCLSEALVHFILQRDTCTILVAIVLRLGTFHYHAYGGFAHSIAADSCVQHS